VTVDVIQRKMVMMMMMKIKYHINHYCYDGDDVGDENKIS
jgi:hypothetical protein